MAIFEKIFKRKKEEPEEIEEPAAVEPSLPRELEDFRLTRPPIEEKPSPFEEREKRIPKFEDSRPFVPHDIMERATPQEKKESVDKLELILSKLETIDARLRLIEEKLK